MKNTFKKFCKRYWIPIVCFMIASTIITVFVAYAAYPKTNKAKLVVARYGDTNKLFSSNYLQGSDMSNIPLYVTEGETNPNDIIRICNYAQGNTGVHYKRTIDYEVKLKLVYRDGENYSVVSESDAATTIGNRWIKATVDGTDYIFGKNGNSYINLSEVTISANAIPDLAGNESNTHSIPVVFSPDQVSELTSETELKKLYLEMVVTPTPKASYKDIDILQGRIGLALDGEIETDLWEGYFSDEAGARNAMNSSELSEYVNGFSTEAEQTLALTEKTVTISSQLDGYNYVIEGIGSGTVTLSWDSDYLELNEGFRVDTLNNATVTTNGSTKSITFNVNSGSTSRFDTQFYRSGKDEREESDYDTWNKLNGYVTFSFTKN